METFESNGEAAIQEESAQGKEVENRESIHEVNVPATEASDSGSSPLIGQESPDQEIPPELLPFLSNPYVDSYKNGKLFYKPGFHKALLEKLEAGLTAREAYDELGFDTKVLGYDRAYGAAKRAREKAKAGTLDSEEVEAEVTATEEEVKAPQKEKPVWLDDILQNPYVASYSIDGGRIHYTDEFYDEMAKLLAKGNTAVQAYEALGFPVEKLGKDRANQAAVYAKKLSQKVTRPIVGTNGASGKKSLVEIMDSLGTQNLDPNNPELSAAVFARAIYLETILDGLKKKK